MKGEVEYKSLSRAIAKSKADNVVLDSFSAISNVQFRSASGAVTHEPISRLSWPRAKGAESVCNKILKSVKKHYRILESPDKVFYFTPNTEDTLRSERRIIAEAIEDQNNPDYFKRLLAEEDAGITMLLRKKPPNVKNTGVVNEWLEELIDVLQVPGINNISTHHAINLAFALRLNTLDDHLVSNQHGIHLAAGRKWNLLIHALASYHPSLEVLHNTVEISTYGHTKKHLQSDVNRIVKQFPNT